MFKEILKDFLVAQLVKKITIKDIMSFVEELSLFSQVIFYEYFKKIDKKDVIFLR